MRIRQETDSYELSLPADMLESVLRDAGRIAADTAALLEPLDLRAMEDHIDSKDSLQLYRTFANPEQTRQYPYMIAGPLSPLSFTQAPLFVTTFRPGDWVRKNEGWIAEQARKNGVQLREVTLEGLKAAVRASRSPDRVVSQGEHSTVTHRR